MKPYARGCTLFECCREFIIFILYHLFMNLKGLLRYVATMLLVACGCAYENEEIYYKEIIQPEHEITFILEKYDNADTIYLSAPETFTYEVGINPGEIERVQLLLGDRVLLTSRGGRISYPFSGDVLQEGIHDLTIRFVATTGSGSLAENTGVEKLNVARTWMLKIDL